jgi:hypothetical protein
MSINRTERLHEGNEFTSFGVADKSGRDIGCRICYEVEVFEETILNTWGYWGQIEAGTYFSWTPHATRAGKDFGPIQPVRRCTTEADRFNQIQEYLIGAEKRAAKTAAK